MRRRPVLLATADVYQKIAQDFFAFDRVIDFGVELEAIKRILGYWDIGILVAGCRLPVAGIRALCRRFIVGNVLLIVNC